MAGRRMVAFVSNKAGAKCSATNSSECCSVALNSIGNHDSLHLVPLACSLDAGVQNFSCPQCSVDFEAEKDLMVHNILIHGAIDDGASDGLDSGVQNFSCPHCGVDFEAEQDLMKHNILVHGEIDDGAWAGLDAGVRNFSCPQCRVDFEAEQDLMKHNILVHGEIDDGAFPMDHGGGDDGPDKDLHDCCF